MVYRQLQSVLVHILLLQSNVIQSASLGIPMPLHIHTKWGQWHIGLGIRTLGVLAAPAHQEQKKQHQ